MYQIRHLPTGGRGLMKKEKRRQKKEKITKDWKGRLKRVMGENTYF